MLPANILATPRGRLTAFSLLYLSEGIPFGFSATALATYLRQSGLSIGEVGLFIASLYAPWGFKPFWAPIVDLVDLRRFGHYRSWIVFAQVMMILTLALVWAVDPGTNLKLLTLLIVIHNIFAATQDIAIDALAVNVLPASERGLANGFMFGASYLGQALGGSGALYIAGRFGFGASYPFVCGLLAIILVAVSMRIVEPQRALAAAGVALAGRLALLGAILGRFKAYVLELGRGFFRSGRGPLLGMLFAAVPNGALALGLALGNTMQVDLGLNEDQIANLNVQGTVLAAIGCVLGGWVSDRLGHRKMLALWYALTTLPTFWLSGQFSGAAGMEGVTVSSYWGVSLVYSFFSGLISGTNIAVFMGLTSPLVAATQFSGYMALRNLTYTYSSAWQGQYAELHGYMATLRLDAWIAFLPILLIPFLRPRRGESVGPPAEPVAPAADPS
jgi:PAT family beta-lactamase induction signal transducer AmpG